MAVSATTKNWIESPWAFVGQLLAALAQPSHVVKQRQLSAVRPIVLLPEAAPAPETKPSIMRSFMDSAIWFTCKLEIRNKTVPHQAQGSDEAS